MGQWIGRWLVRIFFGCLLLLAVTYAADWAVWRVRNAHGTGFRSIAVSRFVVAPLKGNKVEYYPDGTEQELCSRSLFGHGAAEGGACWWLERHRFVEE